MPVKQEKCSSASADESGTGQPTTPPRKSSPKKRVAKGSVLNSTPGTACDSEDDSKPALSDDEIHIKPSPAKRGRPSPKTSSESHGGIAKSPSARKSGSPAKAKAIPYTPEQDWALVEELRPRTTAPNWGAIAQRVGRDAKSCKNRWALLGKKIEGAVKGIGSS